MIDSKELSVIGGDWASVRSDVPHGTVLGCLLFLLFINNLPHSILSHVCLSTTLTPKLFSMILMHCLYGSLTSKCASMWINDLFWKVLMLVNTSSNIQIRQFNSSRNAIHTYLGVDIKKDLKWNDHIDCISSKGNWNLGFIKRNHSSCTEDIKSMAYKTLVRPTIEYCSAVWDPWTGIHSKRVARFVKKKKKKTDNHQ